MTRNCYIKKKKKKTNYNNNNEKKARNIMCIVRSEQSWKSIFVAYWATQNVWSMCNNDGVSWGWNGENAFFIFNQSRQWIDLILWIVWPNVLRCHLWWMQSTEIEQKIWRVFRNELIQALFSILYRRDKKTKRKPKICYKRGYFAALVSALTHTERNTCIASHVPCPKKYSTLLEM